jgi:hypothetical protein
LASSLQAAAARALVMAKSKRAKKPEGAIGAMVSLKVSAENRAALKFIAAMSGRRLLDVSSEAIVRYVRSFRTSHEKPSKRTRK